MYHQLNPQSIYHPSFSAESAALARTDMHKRNRAAATFSRQLRVHHLLNAHKKLISLVCYHLSYCEDCLFMQEQLQQCGVEAVLCAIRKHIALDSQDYDCLRHQAHGRLTLLHLTRELELHLQIRASILAFVESLPQ